MYLSVECKRYMVFITAHTLIEDTRKKKGRLGNICGHWLHCKNIIEYKKEVSHKFVVEDTL